MFRGKTHGSVEAGPGLSMGLSSGKHPRDDGSDDGIDDEAGKDMHSWTTAGGSHNLQSIHNSHRQRSLQFSASLPAAASSSGSSMRRVRSTQDASACGAGM